MYTVTLDLGFGKEVYKAKSETIEEAIVKLNYPPSHLSGVMTFKEGKIKFERKMYPRLLRKLSANKIFRQIVAKSAKTMIESQK